MVANLGGIRESLIGCAFRLVHVGVGVVIVTVLENRPHDCVCVDTGIRDDFICELVGCHCCSHQFKAVVDYVTHAECIDYDCSGVVCAIARADKNRISELFYDS